MIEILFFEDKYKSKWDDYVEQSPSGTFYHLSGWKYILEKTFGFESIYLMAQSKAGEIKGVLPLFLMKDIIGRKYLISSPSSNFAGVCACNDEASNKLFTMARKLAVEKKVQYMEVRHLAKKVYDLPTNNAFVTMYLKLSHDEELVWKNSLNSKARNQTRRAYREGLTVDFGKEYLDDFYRVLSINFRELGTPIFPKKFFRHILDEFKNNTNLIVVKYQKNVIGGMIFISYRKTFSDPWASSLKKYNMLCPNNILYWEAIKYACRNGFEYFDFGRSTLDSGTFKFKKQWGAEPVQLYYQYFLNNAARLPDISSHNNQYRRAINLWRKLPIVITNALGPMIVKYLPGF
jgi:serine/alanine adding enzyme